MPLSKMNTIRAVVVRGGVPAEEQIGTDLKAMQDIVAGYVEHVSLRHPLFVGLDLWCNEEGLINELPVYHQPLYPGPLHGDYFITRSDEEGEISSLTDDDVALVIGEFETFRMARDRIASAFAACGLEVVDPEEFFKTN